MTTENLIAASDFCVYHHIEYTFINSLQEAGLVDINIVNEHVYIPEDQLQRLEKMIRLHNELEINVAGIEAIAHLLDRVEAMQHDIQRTKNRLSFYESE